MAPPSHCRLKKVFLLSGSEKGRVMADMFGFGHACKQVALRTHFQGKRSLLSAIVAGAKPYERSIGAVELPPRRDRTEHAGEGRWRNHQLLFINQMWESARWALSKGPSCNLVFMTNRALRGCEREVELVADLLDELRAAGIFTGFVGIAPESQEWRLLWYALRLGFDPHSNVAVIPYRGVHKVSEASTLAHRTAIAMMRGGEHWFLTAVFPQEVARIGLRRLEEDTRDAESSAAPMAP